jgi:hypothetical protein
MKDGWGKFGAGCLGLIIGWLIMIELDREEEDTRLSEKITDRMQRALQFHFDNWQRQIEEAQRGDG